MLLGGISTTTTVERRSTTTTTSDQPVEPQFQSSSTTTILVTPTEIGSGAFTHEPEIAIYDAEGFGPQFDHETK